MPGKSKHGKGRRTQYKNKIRQSQPAVQNASAAASAAGAPAVTAPVMAKTVITPKAAASAPDTAARYPFFMSELKTIGVITAVILVILIVLSFIIQ